jgi:hypothetical protein
MFFFLVYISTQKIEAIYSSETSVNFYQTTKRFIWEDRRTVQFHWKPINKKKTNPRGFKLPANRTGRAIAACRRG